MISIATNSSWDFIGSVVNKMLGYQNGNQRAQDDFEDFLCRSQSTWLFLKSSEETKFTRKPVQTECFPPDDDLQSQCTHNQDMSKQQTQNGQSVQTQRPETHPSTQTTQSPQSQRTLQTQRFHVDDDFWDDFVPENFSCRVQQQKEMNIKPQIPHSGQSEFDFCISQGQNSDRPMHVPKHDAERDNKYCQGTNYASKESGAGKASHGQGTTKQKLPEHSAYGNQNRKTNSHYSGYSHTPTVTYGNYGKKTHSHNSGCDNTATVADEFSNPGIYNHTTGEYGDSGQYHTRNGDTESDNNEDNEFAWDLHDKTEVNTCFQECNLQTLKSKIRDLELL